MKDIIKKGFYFKTYEAPFQSPFEKLLAIFKELITHTSGDFDEAIDWLRELDKEYKLTDEHYTIDDFIDDLKKKGYIREFIFFVQFPQPIDCFIKIARSMRD